MSTDRKYDLVIYGATGFTGAYTAEYIANLHDKKLKWALAGRSIPKLEKVRDTLATINPTLKSLDLLVVDSFNPDSLDEAFKQTKVIISAVGPFEKYGTPVVESCIRQGTHYVDISGEYIWFKSIIDKYHNAAQEKGVIIVPACGFDCVPSDIGAYMVVSYIRKKFGYDTSDIKLSVTRVSGKASGGTIQTALGMVAHENAREARAPYYLSPVVGIEKFRIPWMRWDSDFKKWQAYYIMSQSNELVVRRSFGIFTQRGKTYGKTFKYGESMSFPFFGALLITAFAVGVLPWIDIVLRFSPIYKFISAILPKGGSGPSRETINRGSFEMELIGTAETEPYENPIRVRGVVRGRKDPGYGDTCRMVAEAALSIVYGYDDLPGKSGGILTPASAFGDVLLTRLRNEGGMDFMVEQME